MLSSAALRRQIESALEQRIPGALTPRPRVLRDVAATGLPELDTLLDGGLPVGAITELVGAQCSGRTTLALSFFAEQTHIGKAVAWVDASDALDPESAAAAGVDLNRQLWVRCGNKPIATSPRTGTKSPHTQHAPLFLKRRYAPASSAGGGGPHPRGEVHGLSQAIDAFMQPDTFARRLTQGSAASNPIARTKTQVPMAKPGYAAADVIPICTSEPEPASVPPNYADKHPKPSLAGKPPSHLNQSASPLWKALDQALRATDLLLAAGGFSAIVLDLGSTPPEFAWRIPLATWFRFRAAAERARTVLLLLTQHPCARSSAELVLRLGPTEAHAASTVLTAAGFGITIDRQRFETHNLAPTAAEEQSNTLHLVSTRRPPQRDAGLPNGLARRSGARATTWQRSAAWARGGR